MTKELWTLKRLNERQIKAVMYVKGRVRITYQEYQELTNNIETNSNNRSIGMK
jgi:hypothetical protein